MIVDGSIVNGDISNSADIAGSKLSLVSTSSTAGIIVKGDGSSDGYLQLNCSQNSHGIKLKSPPHSASQSYTLTFPSAIVNGAFLKTDSNGNLSFAAVNTDLVNDTSPQLGGNLDTNDKLIKFNDAVAGNNYSGARFGDDDDLWIYHTPGNLSVIRQNTSGKTLTIQNAGGNTLVETLGEFRIQSWEGENIGKFVRNGGVLLYHNNNLRFEITDAGATLTGGLTLPDNEAVRFGAATGGDLKLYHDSTNSIINNKTGNFKIGNSHSGGNIIFYSNNANRWHIDGNGHFLPRCK